MKKFLLSMVALLSVSYAASATTLPAEGKVWKDYTWNQEGVDFKGEVEGYTLVLAKGSSTSTLKSPDQYSIRVYAGANLTVTAPAGETFNKVTVTINTTGNKATEATASEGWTVSTFADDQFTLTSATAQSSVTFDGAGKQLRVASIKIENGGTVTPDPELTPDVVTKSVKETIALASGTQFTTDYALTVGWKYGSNVFVCDEAGDFIQIYHKDNTLKVGDVIPAGLKGTYTLYKDVTPEIEKITTLPEATAGTFTAAVVPAKDITVALVNSVVTIDNVVIDAATPGADVEDNNAKNFVGKVGDVELNLRNHYNLESVPAGTYNVTVVVTVFNEKPSLYVTEFATPTGIADITVDENAAVEYFNLQGIRVAQPEQGGIYIRRQGNSVSKVLVK